MPTLEDSRNWDNYSWPLDGDEWADQAAFCGIPYPTWKQDLIDSFILKRISNDSVVLEIAQGHGRWTQFLIGHAKRYIGVDLSQKCTEFCKTRFSHLTNAKFYQNDGQSLPMVEEESVDFIWSFDTFVHIEDDITRQYLNEFIGVLVPGGLCCIHHPGTPTQHQMDCGGRSRLTKESFALIAKSYGFEVLSQEDTWGPNNRCNTKLFADCISTIRKPLENTKFKCTKDVSTRAFLLTIDRGVERREKSISQLRSENVEFEIVDGIDGKTSLKLPSADKRIKNTVLGCYYTHCRAYRRILDYRWSKTLILEDDFLILEPGKLRQILKDIPSDCDWLSLHHWRWGEVKEIPSPDPRFKRLQPCAHTTLAHIISRRLANHILANYSIADRPIDHLFMELSKDSEFRFYELTKPAVVSIGAASLIND